MLLSLLVTLSSVVTALMAAGTAYVLQSHNTPCHGIELVWLAMLQGDNDEVSVNACDYFSDNYTQARERFRRAAQLIPSARLEQVLVYSEPKDSRTKQHNHDYYMDICILPGSQPGLVIHTSGVHGVEGYAGSAIQLALLDSPSLKTKHSDRPTLVLIHAVNPYGMAYYRRVNEHNVDLNRNAMTKEEFADIQVRHNASHTAYRSLESFLNPQQAPTLVNAYATFVPNVIWHLSRHGLATIKAAMVSGQYYNERGIFYGGSHLEASTAHLEQWLHKYLAKHSHRDKQQHGAGGNYDTITWVDVHTGLGPSGQDTLLPGSFASQSRNDTNSNGENASAEWIAYYSEQLERWFPNSSRPTENSVASGYEEAKGLYGGYFDKMLQQHDERSFFFVQEFGTLPSILVGHALMTENAAFQFGNHSINASTWTSASDWAKRTMLPAFYLQHPEWRRRVLQQGVRVAWQSMERSRYYASSNGDEQLSE